MAELTRQVEASTDDCYVFDTTIRLARDYIMIDVGEVPSNSYMRFLNITIPPGSRIDHAHIELCSYGFNGGTSNLFVRGIKEPNTATFSTADDAEARPATVASVPYDLDALPGYFNGLWEADTWHGAPPDDGPELKEIIQEIVAQAGWASGNSLAIKIEALFTGISRSVWSWDGEQLEPAVPPLPAKAPILVINYTLPSEVQHTLSILTTMGGTTNPAPGPYPYDENTLVDVLAIPNADYQFLNWDLDGLAITDNPITVLMDTDHTLIAMFEVIPVTPSKVSGLSATNIAETSFSVDWNPSPPEEEATLYRVYLRKVK